MSTRGSIKVFGESRRVHIAIAGAIGINVLLGAAAAAGVVPRPEKTESIASIQPASEAGDEALFVDVATAETVPTTTPPETTVPPTTPPTAPPTTKAAPKPAAPAQSESQPAATQAPATTPTTAAPAPSPTTRPNPSSAQVLAAASQLKARNPLFNVTEAQARQFGDGICDAFDQGLSYSEVQAGILQMVASVPLIKVSAADADFAIRTAVSLFCPGYASKLP